jgi:hypothetical protein
LHACVCVCVRVCVCVCVVCVCVCVCVCVHAYLDVHHAWKSKFSREILKKNAAHSAGIRPSCLWWAFLKLFAVPVNDEEKDAASEIACCVG